MARVPRWSVALVAAGVLLAIAAFTANAIVPQYEPGTQTPAAIAANDDTLGPQLLALRYAEAVAQQRVADAMAVIAALSRWPQPAQPPAAHAAAVFAAAPRQASAPPAAPRVWTDATFAAALIDAVNIRRASAGLAPFAYDGRLAAAASSYALRLAAAGEFGHDEGGSSLLSRLDAAGVSGVAMGEVLAWSAAGRSPSVIVQMWMDSEGHRAQILSPTFALAGAGCAFDDTQVRCVIDFAG